MGWLRDRRLARKEAETEVRLRRLIYNVCDETMDFYIPAAWVAILGQHRVNAVLREYGVPPVRSEPGIPIEVYRA